MSKGFVGQKGSKLLKIGWIKKNNKLSRTNKIGWKMLFGLKVFKWKR